jgi:hypothetical protein
MSIADGVERLTARLRELGFLSDVVESVGQSSVVSRQSSEEP